MCRTGAAIAAVAGCLAAAVAAAQDPAVPPAVERVGKEVITRNALEAPIRFLADDALEGRGPATRGDTLARLYLSTQLQALGYEPGAPNGQWQQTFDIVGIAAQVPQTWAFTAKGKSIELKVGEDFIAASGVQQETSAISDAQLVFVGYGIEAPEYHWNDFKGVDVKGKVLVMMNNDPDWDPKLFAGERRLYYGRWTYKYESAARHGAAGAIIIHTTPSAGYPWQVVQTSWSQAQFELPAESEPRVQIRGWATEDATRRLLAAAGQDLDKLVASARSRNFKPVPLDIRTSIELHNKVSSVQSANVAGLLRGSDPKLADEVVVYSAHHDHLGVGRPDFRDKTRGADRIYNGAVDNAAGCGQVLAIAHAIAALPERPRRSALILFVAGEEQGLLGSLYYARHPTFAPGKIAANINYDGGNIWGATRDVSLISGGKASIDKVAEAVAAWQGRVVKPDPFPDRGTYYRSDQFSFAKIGVPALYFHSGTDFVDRPTDWGRQQMETYTRTRYHQPSDQIDDSWNFDGMIQDAQLGFYSGWMLQQSDAPPQWNPGDEFEPARKEALRAVSMR
jgi:Zn-dependent M28 family amino/carboxypeptidase